MSLPFYSNTVTITPLDDSGDRWEAHTPGTPVTGVPAIISNAQPSDVQTQSGEQQTVTQILHIERAVSCTRGDQVTDEDSGDVYEVVWVHVRTDELLGLDRKRAGLVQVGGHGG